MDTLQRIFDQASSVMTVVAFATFCGIVAWAWARRNQAVFAQAALLPFADEARDVVKRDINLEISFKRGVDHG